jgi:flagellar basal body-associated protein FliL
MDGNDDEEETSTKVHSKGYGKHSVWWWVVVYLIAAVIVYGIIYLIFFNHTGSSSVPGY